MEHLSQRSQDILTGFSHQAGVSADQVANLRAAIESSPALVTEFNQAVAQGYLRQVVPLTNPHAGGEYSSANKAMNLPLDALTTGSPNYSQGNVIFVLGHELQHGFNNATTKQATQDFYSHAKQIAMSSAATHDYTAAVDTLITANRHDEASAEIAGWNAVVSSVKATKPNPTLDDIYDKIPGRMADFLDYDRSTASYVHKPNITLNEDLTLSPTEPNVKGMGENYFDHLPSQSQLGYRGSSDYTNYYGTYAVSVIGQLERQYHPPQQGNEPVRVTLDMRSLRLSENLMEENGIDLGPDTHPLPYMDRSTSPPTLHHFDHTATTHTYVPIQSVARQLGAQDALAPTRLDHPSHPGHTMFQQGLQGIQQLNAQHGVAPTPRDSSLAGALAVEATSKGLNRIDHVLLNDDASRVFAVQGAPRSVEQKLASVDTVAAINTSLEQSSAQWQQAAEHGAQVCQASAVEQAPQQEAAMQAAGPTR